MRDRAKHVGHVPALFQNFIENLFGRAGRLVDLKLWNTRHGFILGGVAWPHKQTAAGKPVNAETRPIEDRASDIAERRVIRNGADCLGFVVFDVKDGV